MKLSEIDANTSGGFAQVSCRLDWEDVPRPATRIAFSIPESVGIKPAAAPEAFLLAAIAPAIAAGERRIRIDAPLSAMLLRALPSAIAVLRHWTPADFANATDPLIEHAGATTLAPAPNAGAGAFYSGGVDSTHLLLATTREADLPDWARMRHAICIYGFDLGGRKDEPEPAAFARFLDQSQPFSHALGVPLLPVHTTLRHLDDRSGFWGRIFVGFALAAVAQTLREHCSLINVAAPGEPLTPLIQAPFGTHPSLVPYCNTEAARVVMPYVEVSRFQRLALIAQSKDALDALRVCYGSTSDAMNCGRCEKCVRTQLGLLLHGVRTERWFSDVPVNADLIDQADLTSTGAANMAKEMLECSAMRHHPELQRATERQIDRWNRYKKWQEGRTLGGRLRRLANTVTRHL